MKKLLLVIRVFKYALFSKAVNQEIKFWYKISPTGTQTKKKYNTSIILRIFLYGLSFRKP